MRDVLGAEVKIDYYPLSVLRWITYSFYLSRDDLPMSADSRPAAPVAVMLGAILLVPSLGFNLLPVLPGGRQVARVDARMQAPASRKVSVRYISEEEMEALAYNASLQKGFEPSQAMMLAACTRNIYAIGTGYHPTTVTLIEEVCKEQAKEGAAWAVLMLELLAGRMPRLRSEKTAAARSAAAARKRTAKRTKTNS